MYNSGVKQILDLSNKSSANVFVAKNGKGDRGSR